MANCATIRPPLSPVRLAASQEYYRRNLERIAWLAQRRGMGLVLVTPVSRLTHPALRKGCPEDGSDCAETLYEAGLALRGSDPSQGAALLRRARDVDHPLMTATSQSVETVRTIAEASSATLVDATVQLPRAQGLDVPAGDLFLDRIHFSRRGHQAMAELIAPAVEDVLSR